METKELSRAEVVRRNASYRMKGLTHLVMPLPPKPEPVYGWELWQRDTYMGFTKDEKEMREYLTNHSLATSKKVISIRG